MATDDSWVPFETAESFKAATGTSVMMNRDDRRDHHTKNRDSSAVKATWMEGPIASDASWMPLRPPRYQEATDARDDWDSPRPNSSQAALPPLMGRGDRASSTGSDVNNQSHASSRTSSSRSFEKPSQRARDSDRTPSRGRSGKEDRDQQPSYTGRRRRSGSQQPSDSGRHGHSGSEGGQQSFNTGRRTRERSSSQTRAEPPSEKHGSSSKPAPKSRSRSSRRTRVESPSPNERTRSTSRTRIESPSPPRRCATEVSKAPEAKCRGQSSSIPRSELRSRSASRSRQVAIPSPRQVTPGRPSSTTSLGRGFPPRHTESISVSSERFGGRPGAKIHRSCNVEISKTAKSVKSPRKEGGILERFFGDPVSQEARNHHCTHSNASIGSLGTAQQPESIHPKVLLCATVYKNAATGLWIATINTNQKGVATNPKTASKYLKAFSFPSEQEAREAAIANAPPKMIPFDTSPNCFVCKGKFAVFRRACHCRNCGACVCSGCTTAWSSKMLPETYNLKKESVVKICKSCSYLTESFRKVLLQGDCEAAQNLYATGNINLRCPLPATSGTTKSEIMYPVHCAVHGGNLNIVRWLMDEHFCPITLVLKTSNGKGRKSRNADGGTSILTSKGRSVLNIAMHELKVDIVRYLVVDKGVSVYEVKDLQLSLRALEAVLLAFPQTRNDNTSLDHGEIAVPRWDNANFSDGDASYVCSSLGADQSILDQFSFCENEQEAKVDMCIICYDNCIDCVITPCGHQICCLECSSNLKICPVCNVDCAFIRIFKPY